MRFTNAISKDKVPFMKNPIMMVLLGVFMVVWGSTLIHTTDMTNWIMENALVFIFGGVLVFTYKKYQFSDLTYLLICVYLILHVYGSKYTYAENPFGYWLQDYFDSSRNHYDRIVHFSFGFMLPYPMREMFLRIFKFPTWVAWILPIELTLSISGLYELIEWAVADIVFPEQGAAYLGSQGDIWDAQKDMFLATLGAILATTIVSTIKKTFKIE